MPSAASNPVFLGIEIGGTKLQIVTGHADGTILSTARHQVIPRDGADGIRRQIAATLTPLCAQQTFAGIGIGFGGPADWRTGKVYRSHQIAGWSDFSFNEWLHKFSSAPVRIDNDANVAALAEATLGAGRAANPVFYITLGSGVGGGLIIDGAIYHGAVPGEAEIGHVRLSPAGETIESRCSGWAVDARIRAYALKYPECLLAQLCAQDPVGVAKHLTAACEQNDPAALQIVNETANTLAFGLSHVTHLFHPSVIVIGGGLAHLGERLRNSVVTQLKPMIMSVFAPGPAIVLSTLGDTAVPAGALLLAAQSVPAA